MGKRRWDRKKRRMRVTKPRVAEKRAERLEVYRDPGSNLLLKVGPDHGPEERRQHDGGIFIGEKIGGLAQTAWAVAPGALERLRLDGGLLVGLLDRDDRWEILDRWMEAAEILRSLATRAGCQRRLTGRYDIGVIGRGEMSEKAIAAFDKLTELADRLTWSRLGPLLDLVLYDKLPPGLRRPLWRSTPSDDSPEYPLYQQAVTKNPAFVEAMRRAIEENNRLLPAREQVWEQACREVQDLLDRLAFAFGLRGPKRPQ